MFCRRFSFILLHSFVETGVLGAGVKVVGFYMRSYRKVLVELLENYLRRERLEVICPRE